MTQKKRSARRAPTPKIELVLGGGGIKGFAHIGLLHAIEERRVNIGTITGVSIGSAVAALYANGYKPRELTKIFLQEVKRLSPTSPDRSVRARGLLRGGMDLQYLFDDVGHRYDLRPRRNLRILSYNLFKREPVLFQGTHYNLPVAIAASCSIPWVMRPVWFGQDGTLSKIATVVRSLRRTTDEGLLIDGGVHHTHPGEFCQGPAIISKLGFASHLPSEWLTLGDLGFHLAEVIASPALDWYFSDSVEHLVIPVGMPDVGCLTFGLSDEKCLEMVDYGYEIARQELARGIASGFVPVK